MSSRTAKRARGEDAASTGSAAAADPPVRNSIDAEDDPDAECDPIEDDPDTEVDPETEADPGDSTARTRFEPRP